MKYLLVAVCLWAICQALPRDEFNHNHFLPGGRKYEDIRAEKFAKLAKMKKAATEYEYKKGTKEVEGCGVTGPSSRIAGGTIAERNEFPWQAVVMDSFLVEYSGVLISDRHVITSGYAGASDFWIVLVGGYDLSTTEGSDFIVNSTQGVVHPNYNGFEYDVTIITLPVPVPLSESIRPICLPSYSDAEQNFTGESVVITGWGETETHPTSDILQKGDTTVITQSECSELLSEYLDEVPATFICTSATGAKTCLVDEGGPLNYERDSKTYLLGINSLLTSCAPDQLALTLPDIFTRTTAVLDFIETTTGIAIDP